MFNLIDNNAIFRDYRCKECNIELGSLQNVAENIN